MFWQSHVRTRWVRIGAALVLMGFGGSLIATGLQLNILFGALISIVGSGVAIAQGIALWRERSDPYDLSKLWDKPPDEPEADNKFRNTTLCHRCGTSLPESYSICTVCGNRLGS